MLRSSLAAAFSAVLAAGIAQSAAAQEAAEQRLGAVHFETSCNDAAQRRFDRGMRYQHSFWYRASKEIFEDTLKADPDCAIAYWGIATSLLLNPFGVPPAANLRGRARGHSEGQGDRRQDAARKRIHRRARRVLYGLRQARPPHPGAGLSQGDGGGGATLSAGRRGANLLCACARRRGFARRQDLRQSAQGGRDPGGYLQTPAATSRRRALSHSLLRLSAHRRQRASTPPRAIPRSRRRRRTRSTCRPTSSPASATGRNRSPPTRLRCARPRPTRSTATSSTARTTWSMPICSSRRTRTRAP